MKKRLSISNKIRFEVFKRDSFTCQYCGKKAPEVVLNVDHIHPVKEGGTNDILNLITSCFECNNGKRAAPLDDHSILHKQRSQIEELNERRNQLEMMLQWRNGLSEIVDIQVDNVFEFINKHMPGSVLKDHYKDKIKSWIKKYDTDIIYDAIETAALKYIKRDASGNATTESASIYVSKISGIIHYKSQPPLIQKINWLKNIGSKAFNVENWKIEGLINNYVNQLKAVEWDDDQIIDDLDTEILRVLNSSKSYWQFENTVLGWIEDIKKW